MESKFESARIGNGIYTAKDAALIFKIPYSKANYWFNWYLKKGKFNIDYQYHFAIRDKTAVNFLTLIEMYVFYTFKENGVKTKNILEAHNILSKQFQTPYPFAQEDYYISGKNIYVSSKDQIVSADKKLQFVSSEALIPYSKKINFGNDKLAHKFFPLETSKNIVVDPKHQFGQPTISGTNILAATIYDWHLGKEEDNFIAELYNISLESVRDAVKFCTPHKVAA